MGGEDITVTVDSADSGFNRSAVPPFKTVCQNLLLDNRDDLTPVLNLDCTTLIALVSDIPHSRVALRHWHRDDVKSQIRKEADEGSSLEQSLYPLLRGRGMVCTREAAKRVREIVATLGTDTELARSLIFLSPDSVTPAKSHDELVSELQKLSIHSVPSDLQLPVKIIDIGLRDTWEDLVEEGQLPQVVRAIVPGLLWDVNLEIFLYGWATGMSTVTSNNALAKQIVRQVLQRRTREEEIGPIICVHPATRALASKRRPKGAESE
jgi:hypothetical protein